MDFARRLICLGTATLAMGLGCSPGDTTSAPRGPTEPTEPTDPVDPTEPPPGSMPCGADCVTDLVAARAALDAGDFARAFSLYECADTPEAAFGAGLTRLLLSLEGAGANALMTHLGLAPLAADDFMGPDGILSRMNRRWDGDGALTMTGDLAATMTFDRAQQTLGAYPRFEAEDLSSDFETYFDLSFTDPSALAAGTILPVTFDCTTTYSYSSRQTDPRFEWLSLGVNVEGEHYSCDVPYSLAIADCTADGGRIVVTEGATVVGDRVTYSFENLLLACYSDAISYGSEPLVRVSGTLSAAAVSESVDTSGLHAMFQEDFDFQAALPPATTVGELLVDAAALTPDLEEAACFFRRAGASAGRVGTFPGTLIAGPDVGVTQGDAQVLGAATLLTAAAARLASAFDVPLTVRDLTCGDALDCPPDSVLVERFNAGFAQTFRAEEFAVAQRLANEALPLLDAGMGNLDAESVLVRNATSSAGLVLMRDVVQAATHSLTIASIVIPHVTPAIAVDLRAFFTAARNPRDVGLPSLTYTETCDEWDYCWSETELNPAFLEQYFAGTTDVDWAGDVTYEWSDDTAVEDALVETLNNAARKLLGD